MVPSTNFSTGNDSPVIAACAMNRSRAAITRQSAGTMSPADKAITSPATNSRTASSCPSCAVPARRITVAVFVTIARKPSAARWDRPSCTNRMPVLSATMTPITTVALLSALKNDSRARAVSNRLNGLR